jgi:Predicted phosphohydrolases
LSKDSRKLLAFGDVHFPQQDDKALEVFKRVVQDTKPDLVVCLGDVLDCKAFSTHAPDGESDTPYHQELAQANALFDFIQKYSGKLVMIEGNHEYRVIRYAARERAGQAALSLLSPRKNLAKGRKNFTYVPYDGSEGMNAHYAISPNLVAVHGWSFAQDATRQHLKLSQGKSVIHGHTHRSDHVMFRKVWERGKVEAVSAGCLCTLLPKYQVGSPNTWTHGFVQGFIGSKTHTLYFVPIVDGTCVMPSGKEVAA